MKKKIIEPLTAIGSLLRASSGVITIPFILKFTKIKMLNPKQSKRTLALNNFCNIIYFEISK
jgi:hypothetical protein